MKLVFSNDEFYKKTLRLNDILKNIFYKNLSLYSSEVSPSEWLIYLFLRKLYVETRVTS